MNFVCELTESQWSWLYRGKVFKYTTLKMLLEMEYGKVRIYRTKLSGYLRVIVNVWFLQYDQRTNCSKLVYSWSDTTLTYDKEQYGSSFPSKIKQYLWTAFLTIWGTSSNLDYVVCVSTYKRPDVSFLFVFFLSFFIRGEL